MCIYICVVRDKCVMLVQNTPKHSTKLYWDGFEFIYCICVCIYFILFCFLPHSSEYSGDGGYFNPTERPSQSHMCMINITVNPMRNSVSFFRSNVMCSLTSEWYRNCHSNESNAIISKQETLLSFKIPQTTKKNFQKVSPNFLFIK